MLSMPRSRFTFALLLLALVGCPGGGVDDWASVTEDLDRVVLSAWGSDPSDVWVAGGGLGNGVGPLALHLEGGTWTELDTGVDETFWWVWGAPTGEVFFVGEGGVIVRVVDGVPERMDSGVSEVLYGVWGTSANDVWAVGGNPFRMGERDIVLHYDGSAWTRVTVETPQEVAFFKVSGTATDDVWLSGQDGVVYHYDGATWTLVPTPTSAFLFTIYAIGPDDVWAVGGPPRAMLHWDGSTWQEVDPFGYGTQLNGVSANAAGEVVVVGVGGTKWRRTAGGEWLDESDFDPFFDLHAVWMHSGGDAFAVGGNFLAPGTPGTRRIGVIGYRGSNAPPAP